MSNGDRHMQTAEHTFAIQDGKWRVVYFPCVYNAEDLAKKTKAELIDLVIQNVAAGRALEKLVTEDESKAEAAKKEISRLEVDLEDARNDIMTLRERVLTLSLAARNLIGVIARDDDMAVLDGYTE